MNVSVTERGWTHSRYWQDTDHAMRRKVNALVKECQRRPLEGTGKPDPRKGDLSGFWSRRINRVHRLVYRVTDSALEIVQCRYHP